MNQKIETVVIGGSQAGLATGYHLKRMGMEHVILDENEKVGAAWRNRWDSLRLFTPGSYNDLPGLPFPGPSKSFPGKDDIADYLAMYARRFELPIKTGVKVMEVISEGDYYRIETSDGPLEADNVVVATGAFHRPGIPALADLLDSGIVQLHSSDYRRPSQLQEGAVLVVGAGSSGAEIALESAKKHRVWLSGRDPGQEPPFPAPVIWFIASKILNVANPIGRKARNRFLYPPRGIPRGRVTRKDLKNAGVNWVGRTTGTKSGLPEIEDGRVLEVNNVIWCTGFVTDYSWIDLPVFDDYGYPVHNRGVVESQPGLYFMGLMFQRAVTSALVGGVGKDAKYIAEHIKDRQSVWHQLDRGHSPVSLKQNIVISSSLKQIRNLF